MTPDSRFIELDKALHDRAEFDCGREELNAFIRQFAARHRAAGVSKTMVLTEKVPHTEKAGICAYYTLSSTQIKRETLPKAQLKKLPHYPIPVLLIAQLAVHKDTQGLGLGKIALISALRQCLQINAHLPSYAVVVDALDDSVQGFYEQYGFQVLDRHNGRIRLYLPMVTVERLFGE